MSAIESEKQRGELTKKESQFDRPNWFNRITPV